VYLAINMPQYSRIPEADLGQISSQKYLSSKMLPYDAHDHKEKTGDEDDYQAMTGLISHKPKPGISDFTGKRSNMLVAVVGLLLAVIVTQGAFIIWMHGKLSHHQAQNPEFSKRESALRPTSYSLPHVNQTFNRSRTAQRSRQGPPISYPESLLQPRHGTE
jgi:hypothetical protein